MSNPLETKLESLRSILNADVADRYIVDSSVIGQGFLLNETMSLKQEIASSNNLPRSKIRGSLRSAEAFTQVVIDYEKVGTTDVVLSEDEKKLKILGSFSRNYGGSRNLHISTHGEFHRTGAIEKDRHLLELLFREEERAIEILKSRVYVPEKGLEFIEKQVIRSNQKSAQDQKNQNDELIVSRAIQLAYESDKHVAIITRDSRFADILINSQIAFEKTPNTRGLAKFLSNGAVSLIFGGREEYFVDYNSGDTPESLAI